MLSTNVVFRDLTWYKMRTRRRAATQRRALDRDLCSQTEGLP